MAVADGLGEEGFCNFQRGHGRGTWEEGNFPFGGVLPMPEGAL